MNFVLHFADSILSNQDLMQELQIYVLQYDRDGYGESETHPKRSVKSEVFDVEELADKLQLRHRFYVVGFPWEHTLCGVV